VGASLLAMFVNDNASNLTPMEPSGLSSERRPELTRPTTPSTDCYEICQRCLSKPHLYERTPHA